MEKSTYQKRYKRHVFFLIIQWTMYELTNLYCDTHFTVPLLVLYRNQGRPTGDMIDQYAYKKNF